jgi:hypothetical protein
MNERASERQSCSRQLGLAGGPAGVSGSGGPYAEKIEKRPRRVGWKRRSKRKRGTKALAVVWRQTVLIWCSFG